MLVCTNTEKIKGYKRHNSLNDGQLENEKCRNTPTDIAHGL